MIKTLITNVKQEGGEDRLYRFKSPYVLVYGKTGLASLRSCTGWS